jgi:carboxyl-terminal processing protease
MVSFFNRNYACPVNTGDADMTINIFNLFLPGMKQAFQPLKLALALALGILIGIWFVPYRTTGGNKFSQVLQIINNNYVDTVNADELEKRSLNELLHSLDPHSNYFTADESKQVNEPLEGSFEGIGIEFVLWSDTILVANVIDDGPGAKAGLHVGDKIVKVDDKTLQGMSLKNEDVFKLLRGKGGSDVLLNVFRPAESRNLDIRITRGSVPIKSVDGYFMANRETGYIKLSRFAANTMAEYQVAFEALRAKGMRSLILDLRDNGGGYLNTAQKLADEFLEDGKKILTTKGEHTGTENYQASSAGGFEKGKLIILVNENSASASEILSGALQDNDRALIIGRRTFGKGLVQNSYSLRDGSAVRLTISRYYTPSGRSIQRPYDHGYNDYEDDYHTRFNNGELFIEDSIKNNTSTLFTTIGGRKVYGGGGVVPDIFVALDTSENSALLRQLLEKSVIRELAFNYSEKNKAALGRFTTVEQFASGFRVGDDLILDLKVGCAKAGITWSEPDFTRSGNEVEGYIRSYIAKQVFGNNGYYYVEEGNDKALQMALACLHDERLFEKLVK